MNNLEHKNQHALCEWWKIKCHGYGLPEFSLFAIPNGGARNAVTGAILKREGVRKGVCDLMLLKANKDHAGLFIEMKAEKGVISKDQQAFIDFANKDYKAVVCYSWEEATKTIHEYLKG